jgi:phosphatidylglycerophosphate synthase
MAHLVLSVVADWRFITPNRLTVLSFALTIATGFLIGVSEPRSLILAAFILQIAYIIDCMDGQLARYRGVSSELGSLLDKWSDFVKFPVVVAALTLHASSDHNGSTPLILGLAATFLICYQPYLKLVTERESSVRPWNVLAGSGFLQRNLRFFLFEEAQWYLIVSACLLMGRTTAALAILVTTQGVVALIHTCRAFISVKQGNDVPSV